MLAGRGGFELIVDRAFEKESPDGVLHKEDDKEAVGG